MQRGLCRFGVTIRTEYLHRNFEKSVGIIPETRAAAFLMNAAGGRHVVKLSVY